MSLQQPLLEPGTDVSRYRVEELVARGGMGLVYRARDLRLDRPVALKVLSPELSHDDAFRQRFVRECRLAASLEHPHVVPVYEADDWHGLLYIAMRFIHGADLHTVVAGGPLGVPTALTLLAQAASALDAAHEAGLVHRDVKPGNLMVAGASPGHVPPGAYLYLTDFGLTKQTASLSGLTRSGQFLGSLHYVAPEQIRGEEVDGRADLYALACVAFELLTGAPPFRRDQEAALLWAHMSVPPPALTDVRPDLPAAMGEVLARGLAKDPGDRPSTCGAFVAGLRGASGATPPTPREATLTLPASSAAPPTVRGRVDTPVSPPPVDDLGPDGPGPVPGDRGRRRWLWPVLAGLVVAAVVAGLLLWRPWSGVELTSWDLQVAPYRADLPADWRLYPDPEDQTVVNFGPPDWQRIRVDDPDSLAAAAAVAATDPDRLVGVYVDDADGLEDETAADTASQVLSALPPDSRLEVTTMTEVAGRRAVVLEGALRLDEEQELMLYGVVVGGEVMVLGAAPTAVADDWRPVFEDVVASVDAAG